MYSPGVFSITGNFRHVWRCDIAGNGKCFHCDIGIGLPSGLYVVYSLEKCMAFSAMCAFGSCNSYDDD